VLLFLKKEEARLLHWRMAPLALRRAIALLLVGGSVPAYGERAGVEQMVVAARHFERRDHVEHKEVMEATTASRARRANASDSNEVSSAAGQGRARAQHAISSGSGLDTCVPWQTFSKFTLCTGDAGGDAFAQLAGGDRAVPSPRRPSTNRSLLEEGAHGEKSVAGVPAIPGSWHWWSCDHPGMQSCGFNSCCCFAGMVYNNKANGKKACVERERPRGKDRSDELFNAECEDCRENLGYFSTWLKDTGETFRAPTCGCLACGQGLSVCVPWAVFCKYALGYDPEEEDRPKNLWQSWLSKPTEGTTWQANLKRFKAEYGSHGDFPDNCPGPSEPDVPREQDIQVETPQTLEAAMARQRENDGQHGYTQEEINSRFMDK